MKLAVYQASGFYCLNSPAAGGLRSYPILTAITIVKGQYIYPSAGYATNTQTGDWGALAMGIAAEGVDNSAGASGALDVLVIPLLEQFNWSVPVGNAAVIARANVGVAYELHTDVGQIDLADSGPAASTKGFYIDDFDVSTEAVAANTYGYAIGHFVITT